ncbi:hypothetical protein M0802_007351 [Mischocyttarus mexicanus]|nr:hypothetical protein M0802_007351 [Mischocyttarus mexicanus]
MALPTWLYMDRSKYTPIHVDHDNDDNGYDEDEEDEDDGLPIPPPPPPLPSSPPPSSPLLFDIFNIKPTTSRIDY